jgi:hypothetical protein
MTQSAMYRSISRAACESVPRLRQLGFSLIIARAARPAQQRSRPVVVPDTRDRPIEHRPIRPSGG